MEGKVSVCGGSGRPAGLMQKYDIDKTYEWNYDHSPERVEAEVPRVPGNWQVFGIRVNSPLGIPAGPLLNSRWVSYYAGLGFDVLTYKTVRSEKRVCYDLPNLVPIRESVVDTPGQDTCVDASRRGGSWAISFGMPSMEPALWKQDVCTARKALGQGQVLIVSVVGSIGQEDSLGELAADYGRCARWAVESGAHAVEANFSCPNVTTSDGMLYQMPGQAQGVARVLREAVGATPLILKIGHLRDRDEAAALLSAVDPYVNAVCIVNTISARVLDADGKALFGGASRGIGGPAIRAECVRQVRMVRSIIEERQLGMEVIGVGGASDAQGVRAFLDAGARIVQMATAVMGDPMVGIGIRRAMAGGG